MGNIFRNERKVPVSINFFHVEHAKEIKENQASAFASRVIKKKIVISPQRQHDQQDVHSVLIP